MGKSFIEKAWDLFDHYDPLQLQCKEVLAEDNERILVCEDILGYNREEFITGLELLEELVENFRVIAPKADKAWVDYPIQTTYDKILLLDFFNPFRQLMAESRVNTFRQKVFGYTLNVARQPDFGHFSADFKVT